MERTIDFIERLRASNDGATDYRLAKILDISKSSMVKYTKHQGSMSDSVAKRVAIELDIDPAYVVSCVAAEKCKDSETVKIWERISSQFAASVLLAMPLMLLVFQGIERVA